MSVQFAAGKQALGLCDRCGSRFLLKYLKPQFVKGKNTNWLVCSECMDQDHPQLRLGELPVVDPMALRNPRPDPSFTDVSESRNINWSWNPVGGARASDSGITPDTLAPQGAVGTVTIVIT